MGRRIEIEKRYSDVIQVSKALQGKRRPLELVQQFVISQFVLVGQTPHLDSNVIRQPMTRSRPYSSIPDWSFGPPYAGRIFYSGMARSGARLG